MVDRKTIAYNQGLRARGLPSVFAEEGPGTGPSSKLMEEIKNLRLMGKGQIAQGQHPLIVNPQIDRRMKEAMLIDEGKKDLNKEGIASAFSEMEKAQRRYGIDRFNPPPSPKTRLEREQRQQARNLDAQDVERAIKKTPSINELSPLDAIAAQLVAGSTAENNQSEVEKAITAGQNNKTNKGPENQQVAQKALSPEEFRERERRIAEQSGGLNSMNISDAETASKLTPEQGEKVVQDLFSGSMKEYFNALKQEVPDEIDRDKSLEAYKKEFAEATGLNIDGKPDKSQALMAMGLALMQNRAGKGFNVGRILNAVGQSGEKAMPYMTAAINEAKQAKMAAGKYALQKIESDEDARDAIIASNRALKQQLALEDLKHKNKMEQQAQKALLEGDSAKAAEALKSLGDRTIKIGAKEIKLKRGTDEASGGRIVWQDPVGDVRQVAQSYSKTVKGLNSISEMNDLLLLMKQEAEGTLGGTAGQQLLDQAKKIAKSIGMPIGEFTGGENVSPREQFERKSTALLANFKRYLTSETGNGISTYDVKQIEKALGKMETFSDIDGALMAINEVTPMFTSSLETLENEVELFSDRREYREGDVGSEQYNKVMDFLGREFGKTNLITGTEITAQDGSTITEWDVSY